MIKCKYCIFEFDSMCKNPESDDYGKNVFIAYDGCNNGKRNTVSAIVPFCWKCGANMRGEQE